ncbi:DUF397 domain-containing protein [Streptomyces sp. AC512_CC834]|uniref:DUF397 domain-containing protein n=1 Tax=Streptomyces sp. AC512_CC834 TaxID=2823691 RepID=UPI0035B28FD1
MTRRIHWRKSSYSEGGNGNTCVEITARPSRDMWLEGPLPGHTYRPGRRVHRAGSEPQGDHHLRGDCRPWARATSHCR